MCKIIEQKLYSTWPQLVNDFNGFDHVGKIYRGQSNHYSTKDPKRNTRRLSSLNLSTDDFIFNSWPLISSFDRHFKGFYEFHIFLSQQLEDHNFKARFGKHNFIEIFYLKDCCLLERIYYLQHYGVPTCFMDFSHDPLVALFFAIADVRATNLYNVYNDQPKIHPDGITISLYELNYTAIQELLNVNYIQKDLSFQNYNKYRIDHVHFAFDISPINNCQLNTLNDNMKRQKGCFVLFDNQGSLFTLDQFLKHEIKDTQLDGPLIIEYKV